MPIGRTYSTGADDRGARRHIKHDTHISRVHVEVGTGVVHESRGSGKDAGVGFLQPAGQHVSLALVHEQGCVCVRACACAYTYGS